ncbi:MAG: amidohydrolase family protein [Pseudomonadota bacterium]|nr:amidohydrolase family protein [Pseudomonadota bacterium]
MGPRPRAIRVPRPTSSSIEPGKLADMVLLSQDVLTIAPAAIRDTHVLKTWVGGVEVFDSAIPK